jgi:type II secretory pathway predicted ATPase ExeA
MSALVLRAMCDQHEISFTEVARAAEISRTAISQLANRGVWPARDRASIRTRITEFLRGHGITADWSRKEKAPTCSSTSRPGNTKSMTPPKQETEMLLRKETLSESTRRHFQLARDPFADPRELADVYTGSPDIRYVRESMMDKVRHGGFLAVIGESGAGKSTLREELIDRLQRDAQPVLVAMPYVIAMEDSESKGKILKATAISDSIMATVAPLTRVMSSPDARWRQLHNTLRESSRAGHRHLLLIEEAHALAIPTLKHLKRFIELKDGLRPLISIILLGQPELAAKLSEQNPEVREVVQRVEIVHLPPLDTNLGGYLTHRFERMGLKLPDYIDAPALDAIVTRMTTATGTSRGKSSNLYPLAVHNVLARAFNLAASLGAPRVTAEMVKEGAR